MRIKRKISNRISVGYNGDYFFIAEKKSAPGTKQKNVFIKLNDPEAWRLKLWIGDAKIIWAIENIGIEDAAPLMDFLNVTVDPENLDCKNQTTEELSNNEHSN